MLALLVVIAVIVILLVIVLKRRQGQYTGIFFNLAHLEGLNLIVLFGCCIVDEHEAYPDTP